MTLTDRLGQAKFFYNVGKEYGEVFRGSLTGGAALTFVAKYLGLSTTGAVLVGALLVPVFVLIAVAAGYGVVRWRIIHATIEREWAANPFQRAQIDTLREIRDRLPVSTGSRLHPAHYIPRQKSGGVNGSQEPGIAAPAQSGL
jgi:hypothetical protein